MLKRMILAVVAVLALSSSAIANDQLVQELMQLGQAVDNMSINISKATSDTEAQLLAKVTQQTFATHLSGDPKPEVSVTASAGRCNVLITTPQWRLWSQARNGKIIDHGAKIN